MTTTQETSFESQLHEVLNERRLPRATYRLQFNPQFTFAHARDLIAYLHELGISDVYTSPLYQPRDGSEHGYDTVDYNHFNPALGNEEEFDALVAALDAHEMGLLLDIVPNHMGVGKDNVWWMDVLKHGPSSVYAHYFDIDFKPRNRALDNKVLLPVLGDHYGRVLERGELELVYWHGDFYLHYYENQYPITPDTYVDILSQAHHELTQRFDVQWVDDELLSIITALRHLPPYYTRNRSQQVEMRREQKIARQRFVRLYDHSDEFREALQAALKTINGTVGDVHSFDLLDAILERQPYRLSFWRAAADEINYRRFFNINDMAAIRIEQDEVFHKTHQLTFQLLGEGKIKGLRIDHPDGLWNPKIYFQQLQEAFLIARLRQHLPDDAIDYDMIREQLMALVRTDRAGRWPLYVLVEKILSETEPLPYDWPVYGTTGYDFMNAVTNLFVDQVNEDAFDQLYHTFLGRDVDFGEIIDQTKRQIMAGSLNSELYARSSELAEIVEKNRRYRGFTRHKLEQALMEITVALPIYRTYITADEPVSERDHHYIDEAVALAKQRNPRTPAYLFDFVRDLLLKRLFDDFDDSVHSDMREFVMKYQQMTGPIMAKSVEDTAFYIFNRLTSLNEVGGHPDQFGISVADFHQHNAEKAYVHTMLSTSTHDTKRSEDVRARINVLSEIPDEWAGVIERWRLLNAPAKHIVENAPAPSPNDEYLLYQTMLGAYPLQDDPDFRDRLVAYMYKAVNEAKVHSNWVNSNDAYHAAIADFIDHALTSTAFMDDFLPFQQRITYYGFINSLAQTLLKLTSPGVPDIYQGNELWRFSLVDPDNRRPVDYEQRQHILSTLLEQAASERSELIAQLTGQPEDGRIKLYVIATTLRYRRDQESLFTDGAYHPVMGDGSKGDHVCAFLREFEGTTILVAVPRLIVQLTDGQTVMPLGEAVWQDTVLNLPEGAARTWRNLLTDQTMTASESQLAAADVFANFPVALLEAKDDA